MAPRQLPLELSAERGRYGRGQGREMSPRSQSFGSGTGSECNKRHLRESQHPPILSQQKLSTTTPFEGLQISNRFLTHSLNSKPFLRPPGKKPILAFLATGQHGAAELRVGPDGRLPGRAAVTKTAA
eukprot:scaffold1862_cov104-Isochrysis_galbana.AAC.2